MLKQNELDQFKVLLQTLRARVRGDVEHLTADALDRNENGSESKSPTHLAELGTETYDQEFTLRRVENEQEVLDEIEEAFERINDHTFGICDGLIFNHALWKICTRHLSYGSLIKKCS